MGYDRYLGRTFHTVVIQPTTLCNADCSYCYLPDRKVRREMPLHVAQAVADGIAQQDSSAPVEVVWHGGEPLALACERFEALLGPFEDLRRRGRVTHAVQTNGTLIDAGWCELFQKYGVQVGVSIDGPAAANGNRMDWSGRPIFGRIMHGISTLTEHGVPFSVICVVSPQTIGDPSVLLGFFEDSGAVSIGFNVEEFEGVNTGRAIVDDAAAERFWAAVIRHRRARPGLRVRELETLASYLARARTGRRAEWISAPHDPIPTVAWNGDTVLLSPELLGVRAPGHADFLVGNVLQESLPSMLARAHRVGYVRDFVQGLAACEATCGFFSFCRGAHAGNRWFEHGTFTATETAHCRNTRQALVRALLSTAAPREGGELDVHP
ncbi:cyclophane-forming radical SAM peptide maturase AmcB [Thermomonospora umbrina]|uniref:Radical SAM core domain-containing protein n=1 Tax=Thermomonospora umbrina TaxID=111806 RepID=A0A3D9SNZ3_9ACTN|nr:cyclophane-forming radical SAM peptide maturase AmcB [Thermomonospora umbrina]REE97682.1 uncharacterized protein DFJ69_3156 [Thermomonospora umbrina]